MSYYYNIMPNQNHTTNLPNMSRPQQQNQYVPSFNYELKQFQPQISYNPDQYDYLTNKRQRLTSDSLLSLSSQIDFSNIVSSCIDSFKQRCPERVCNAVIEPAIFIQGEPVLMQLLLSNLLENANKYSGPELPIGIELATINNKVILRIMDQGVGVPLSEREKIFQKFYRIGTEFTRSTKGTGLGLYLCKRISDFHNATLVVSSNEPKGSIFTLTYTA